MISVEREFFDYSCSGYSSTDACDEDSATPEWRARHLGGLAMPAKFSSLPKGDAAYRD